MRRLLLALVLVGCAHHPDAKTAAAAPAQNAPPPDTALTLMVKHEQDLGLSVGQVMQLQVLARKLDAQNAPIQKQLDALDAAHKDDEEESPPPRSMGGGGRRGGMGMSGGAGMGMGGGRRRGMGGGGYNQGTPPPRKASGEGKTDKAALLRKDMADNHAAAVSAAWDVLEEAQRPKARELLEANDFEAP